MNRLFARLSNVEGMNARSNVIVSLLWLFFLTLASTITYGIFGEKEILLYFLIGALITELISIIVAYFIFAFKDPDCLRSETYTLSKLAIEKGQIGDNQSGLIDVSQAKIIEADCSVRDGSNG
ncbi:hypothetical protein [Rodentibacter rarus]|uniref:hypothetical protein n=1 Tax=Rodentibacter rarus TaxID=1908260 RepID=UPI00117BBBD4|nr:hypothetical protein [Rodentibacter rarus]